VNAPATAHRASLLAIDPRSLVLFRASLGAIVLVDLIARSATLADHYTDAGVLPRRALADEPLSSLRFCAHAWGGSAAFEALLFAAAGVLAVAFIAGLGGTAVTVLLWAVTVSLQNRNFMVLNKGDQIFRLLLFWSMFLPSRPRGPVRSLGSAGLLIQAALTWLVSAALKTGREWLPDGTATYYALQMDHGTTAFGHWLGHMFVATRVLTYCVYFLEWGAAFLLFSPVRTSATRAVAIVLLAGMHVGFGLSLRLGFFPAISICALTPFVPACVWERLGVGVGKSESEAEGAGVGVGVREASGDPRGLARPWNAIAGGALVLVLWLNAAAVAGPRVAVPPPAARLADRLRLDQTWAMFAPYPDRSGGWFVITGHLPDGRVVDAYHPSAAPPRREKPERLSATFPTARWLYYMTNLSKEENARELPWFAGYVCRRFDAARVTDEPLRDVEITFFREWSEPDYRKSPATEETLLRQPCHEPPP
jgi:hypothetical protein